MAAVCTDGLAASSIGTAVGAARFAARICGLESELTVLRKQRSEADNEARGRGEAHDAVEQEMLRLRQSLRQSASERDAHKLELAAQLSAATMRCEEVGRQLQQRGDELQALRTNREAGSLALRQQVASLQSRLGAVTADAATAAARQGQQASLMQALEMELLELRGQVERTQSCLAEGQEKLAAHGAHVQSQLGDREALLATLDERGAALAEARQEGIARDRAAALQSVELCRVTGELRAACAELAAAREGREAALQQLRTADETQQHTADLLAASEARLASVASTLQQQGAALVALTNRVGEGEAERAHKMAQVRAAQAALEAHAHECARVAQAATLEAQAQRDALEQSRREPTTAAQCADVRYAAPESSVCMISAAQILGSTAPTTSSPAPTSLAAAPTLVPVSVAAPVSADALALTSAPVSAAAPVSVAAPVPVPVPALATAAAPVAVAGPEFGSAPAPASVSAAAPFSFALSAVPAPVTALQTLALPAVFPHFKATDPVPDPTTTFTFNPPLPAGTVSCAAPVALVPSTAPMLSVGLIPAPTVSPQALTTCMPTASTSAPNRTVLVSAIPAADPIPTSEAATPAQVPAAAAQVPASPVQARAAFALDPDAPVCATTVPVLSIIASGAPAPAPAASASAIAAPASAAAAALPTPAAAAAIIPAAITTVATTTVATSTAATAAPASAPAPSPDVFGATTARPTQPSSVVLHTTSAPPKNQHSTEAAEPMIHLAVPDTLTRFPASISVAGATSASLEPLASDHVIALNYVAAVSPLVGVAHCSRATEGPASDVHANPMLAPGTSTPPTDVRLAQPLETVFASRESTPFIPLGSASTLALNAPTSAFPLISRSEVAVVAIGHAVGAATNVFHAAPPAPAASMFIETRSSCCGSALIPKVALPVFPPSKRPRLGEASGPCPAAPLCSSPQDTQAAPGSQPISPATKLACFTPQPTSLPAQAAPQLIAQVAPLVVSRQLPGVEAKPVHAPMVGVAGHGTNDGCNQWDHLQVLHVGPPPETSPAHHSTLSRHLNTCHSTGVKHVGTGVGAHSSPTVIALAKTVLDTAALVGSTLMVAWSSNSGLNHGSPALNHGSADTGAGSGGNPAAIPLIRTPGVEDGTWSPVSSPPAIPQQRNPPALYRQESRTMAKGSPASMPFSPRRPASGTYRPPLGAAESSVRLLSGHSLLTSSAALSGGSVGLSYHGAEGNTVVMASSSIGVRFSGGVVQPPGGIVLTTGDGSLLPGGVTAVAPPWSPPGLTAALVEAGAWQFPLDADRALPTAPKTTAAHGPLTTAPCLNGGQPVFTPEVPPSRQRDVLSFLFASLAPSGSEEGEEDDV